jgi:hypothetical protein
MVEANNRKRTNRFSQNTLITAQPMKRKLIGQVALMPTSNLNKSYLNEKLIINVKSI